MEHTTSHPDQQQPRTTVPSLLSQDLVSEIANVVSERIRELIQQDRSSEPDPEEFLDKEKAAKVLGLTTSTLSKWIVDSKGPKYCKMGNRVYYKREWLDDYRDLHTFDPES